MSIENIVYHCDYPGCNQILHGKPYQLFLEKSGWETRNFCEEDDRHFCKEHRGTTQETIDNVKRIKK